MSSPPPLPAGRRRRLAAGETLFVAGDRALGLVRVLSGRVELRRPDAAGRDAVMARAGAGGTLAEASLFEARHHCDAVATEPSEVEVLSAAALRRAAAADPELPWRLAAQLARRLVEARARAEWLCLPRAEDRLLAALRARPADATGSRLVGGTWRSLAAECGLAEETAYRALARLERTGRLRRVRTEGGLGCVLAT